jgi:hypothetical protein
VGRQSALHKENNGFAAPTLGRYISMFRGYQILFSIRNPYINRFTNHFSIHSKPSYPQKVVLHSITAWFSPTPSHFAISLLNLQTWSRDTKLNDDSNALHDGRYLMQRTKLFAYVNNIQITWKTM